MKFDHFAKGKHHDSMKYRDLNCIMSPSSAVQINNAMSSTKLSTDIIIVGAGIGGPGSAIALARAGHRVTVLEQSPEFVEVGMRCHAK